MTSSENTAEQSRWWGYSRMTLAESLDYLTAAGVVIQPTNGKWRERGFEYYAPTVGQMLSADDVVTFAANERKLREGR